jgi:hypothetical protein
MPHLNKMLLCLNLTLPQLKIPQLKLKLPHWQIKKIYSFDSIVLVKNGRAKFPFRSV